MTTNTTQTQGTTSPKPSPTPAWYDGKNHAIPHLDRRPVTPAEELMLEHWINALAKRVQTLENQLGVKIVDLDKDLATLTQEYKFSSTSYRVPSLLCKAINDGFEVACEAEEAKDFESMGAHLRMVEEMLDFVYAWGYGVHVNKLTGERFIFSNENAYGATVDKVLSPEEH